MAKMHWLASRLSKLPSPLAVAAACVVLRRRVQRALCKLFALIRRRQAGERISESASWGLLFIVTQMKKEGS